MSSNCIMLPYIYFWNLLLLYNLCFLGVLYTLMNKFSFSQVFNFLISGSEWYIWFLSHHLSGSGREKRPLISAVHLVALSELAIQRDRSSRISTIAVQWWKQNKAGNCCLIEMNSQLLIHFSFNFKHYVRLLLPCLPECFGTFLLNSIFFQDSECYGNACLCYSGGLHNLYLIVSLQFNYQDKIWVGKDDSQKEWTFLVFKQT